MGHNKLCLMVKDFFPDPYVKSVFMVISFILTIAFSYIIAYGVSKYAIN